MSPSSALRATTALFLLVLAACTPPATAWPDNPPTVTRRPGTAVPATEPAAGGDWYRLYFTTPEQTATLDNPTGGIPAEIIATLNAAQQSIDVAVYEFNWQPLADALIDAAERGLRVRLVTDTDTMTEAAIQAIQAAGIPVAEDAREAIMHDKFVVIDGAAVWVANIFEDTVSRIDPATDVVTATIAVPGYPTGIASDGATVWVTHLASGVLSRIDAQTNELIDSFQVGTLPGNIAIGGGAVWVVLQGDDAVAKVDQRTGEVLDSIGVAADP